MAFGEINKQDKPQLNLLEGRLLMVLLPSIVKWLLPGLNSFLLKYFFKYSPYRKLGKLTQLVTCLGDKCWAFPHSFNGIKYCDYNFSVSFYLHHFQKLYLGTDKCGPVHIEEKMQAEPAERCLGKGLLFQFQTTHTCTVNKCSRGYWSTTFKLRPKAVLSSSLLSP